MVSDVLLALSSIICQRTNDCTECKQAKKEDKAQDLNEIWNTYLVLMYLPSLVRSLSEVAFSEPARSIKLCPPNEFPMSSDQTNIKTTHQDRSLNTPPSTSL